MQNRIDRSLDQSTFNPSIYHLNTKHTLRLSVKMDLLGMSAHPQFHFCLALDRGAMLHCHAQTTDRARKTFFLVKLWGP